METQRHAADKLIEKSKPQQNSLGYISYETNIGHTVLRMYLTYPRQRRFEVLGEVLGGVGRMRKA